MAGGGVSHDQLGRACVFLSTESETPLSFLLFLVVAVVCARVHYLTLWVCTNTQVNVPEVG